MHTTRYDQLMLAPFETKMERHFATHGIAVTRRFDELRTQISSLETMLNRLERDIERREHERAMNLMQFVMVAGTAAVYAVVIAAAFAR